VRRQGKFLKKQKAQSSKVIMFMVLQRLGFGPLRN
jgi:hypothetical protein